VVSDIVDYWDSFKIRKYCFGVMMTAQRRLHESLIRLFLVSADDDDADEGEKRLFNGR
jgi:hypothetical protein